MARGSFALLLSALAALAHLSASTPVHSHKQLHRGVRPRHVHAHIARGRTVREREQNTPAKRSDNDSADGLQDRTWSNHSQWDKSELRNLLDDLGLSLNDVRDIVEKYAHGEPPACTSTTSIAVTTMQPTASASASTLTTTTTPAYTSSPSPTPVNGARNMNVVYYAQTPATAQVPLTTICNDPNIDIVVLAFITDFFSAGGYPTLNLASKCWAATEAQRSIGATGLIDCIGDGFATQVASCQAAGKKVMLSLGGAISNMNIPSAAAAGVAAQNLWDLFLGGGTTNASISAARPFGTSVILDGIDFDNEAPAYSTYIPDLAKALRSLMDNDPTGKQYLLSAAPQCPRPDQSIPIPQMLGELDYVWVQFYNNPSCNANAGQGFLDSLKAWSGDLAMAAPAGAVSARGPPKLLIGVLAVNQGTGYVDVPTLQGVLQQVKALDGLDNLAGVMFWDGSYQELSGAGGATSYAEVVREVLA